jgi:hypothetical protein
MKRFDVSHNATKDQQVSDNQWTPEGEPMTLQAAAEDADEWLALIERLNAAGVWNFSQQDTAEKLRGCRKALRWFLTPNAELCGGPSATNAVLNGKT